MRRVDLGDRDADPAAFFLRYGRQELGER